ncbi:hypothetical protein D3C73_1455990 [compost metagenome]
MATAEAPTGRHRHIANQYRTEVFLVRLTAQALDKRQQIRMAEIAALIGAHHLIIRRVQRQRLGTDNATIGKTAHRLR